MIQVQKFADAVAVTKAGTSYSSVFSSTFFSGNIGLLIAVTAGSVTITQQCSTDGVNFYDPVDADGNALGAVVSAQTVTTGKYIQYAPVITKHMRFKIVEGNVAASAVSIDAVVEER